MFSKAFIYFMQVYKQRQERALMISTHQFYSEQNMPLLQTVDFVNWKFVSISRSSRTWVWEMPRILFLLNHIEDLSDVMKTILTHCEVSYYIIKV